MEPSLPLPACALKTSKRKSRVLLVFFSMAFVTALLGRLQLKFKPKVKDFYSFEVKDPKGRPVSLEKYSLQHLKKKKVGLEARNIGILDVKIVVPIHFLASLVVNVASHCQHTEKNYIMLQELYRDFGPSHFTVLAFPCNQFGETEPGRSQEISYFARSNYGVTFPIFDKIRILGSEASPAFRFLIDSSKKEPRWNFWKYLVSPEGKVVKYWGPEEPIESIKPDIAAIVRQVIVKRKEDL